MLFIELLITLLVCLYYQSGFELDISKRLWRVKCILKYGWKIGCRMQYNGYYLKPITGCQLCTIFWSLALSILGYWYYSGEFQLIWVLWLILFTWFSNSIRIALCTIEEIVDYWLIKINERNI